MRLRPLLLLMVLLLIWYGWPSGPEVLGPGIKVMQAPQQRLLPQAEPFAFKQHMLTPLADFSLQAKVLSREDYWLDRESELAPTDLALGWGQMSDEAVLAQIDISQSGRWYHWRVSQFPIPRRAIETQSANMHMIPANAAVAARLDKVKPGQIVSLQGQLVRAQAADGWQWQSSLSREDTGSHACELFYLTDIAIIAP